MTSNLSLTSVAAARPTISPKQSVPSSSIDSLQERAQEFEAIFIAEMLSHTGLGEAIAQDSGFGGQAFSQQLIQSYADQLTQKDVLGIRRAIIEQIGGKGND